MAKHTGLGIISCSLLLMTLSARAALADPPKAPEYLVPEGENLDRQQALYALNFNVVSAMAFSHDGADLAAATEDGTTCLWEVATGRPKRCVTQPDVTKGKATALAFSARDEWVATGHLDGSVETWRRDGRQSEASCQLESLSSSFTLGRPISALVFTPHNGSLLAVGSKNGTVRSCDKTFESVADPARPLSKKAISLRELDGLHAGLFARAAFDSSGRLLAVATSSALGIWNSQTGEKIWLRSVAASALITSMAISPDGRWLATGLLGGGITLWDAATGTEYHLPKGHEKTVTAVAFTADGRWLATGSEDFSIKLWDAQARTLLQNLVGSAAVSTLAFHPGGMVLASALQDKSIAIWDTATGKIIRQLHANAAWIRGLAFNPQGTLLATASDDGQVRIWKRRLPAQEVGPEWTLVCPSGPLGAGIIRAVAFSPPDGKFLAVASDSKIVQVLDVEKCSRAFELESQGGWAKDLAFSADGARLAVASDDASVSIWTLESKKRTKILLGHSDEVRALAVGSEDTRLLVSASMDKTVRLWMAATGQLLHTFAGKQGVRAVDLGKGSTLLAMAAGKEIAVWNVKEQRLLFTLTHGSDVTAVRFSPDGSVLATSCMNGRVRLWETTLGRSIGELRPKDSSQSLPFLALRFNPDGRSVAGSSLGRLTLWNLADRSVQTQLFQGGTSWAAWESEGKLYREDSGELLWQRSYDGNVTPIAPPRPPVPAHLRLSLRRTPLHDADFRPGVIALTVTNAADAGPAYWLRLEGRELAEPSDLHNSISVLPSSIHKRLGPGQFVDMEVQVRLREPARFLRDTHVCVALRHAHEVPAAGSCGEGLTLDVTWPLWPSWRRVSVLALAGSVLALLGGFVLLFFYRRWVFSHPVIQGSLSKHKPIAGLKLRELCSADRALKRAEFFDRGRGLRKRTLANEDITFRSWQRALEALGSPTSCAARFAESLTATLDPLPIPLPLSVGITAFGLSLPPLSLNLPAKIVLMLCGPPVADAQTAAARFTSKQLEFPTLVLFVDLTLSPAAPAEAKKVLEDTHPGTAFIVLSDSALKGVLLARDAAKSQAILLEVIVSQSTLEQIVPYQEGGNELLDEHGCFFYGRQAELERMLERRHQNFLLSGPNFMGKSSLLNALRRELARRYPTIKVAKYQLFSDSLIPHLTSDPSFRGDTPEAFYDWVTKRSSAHQIFLLDETDKFIEKENATNLPFCSVMRALSGQGRASFVLAGYHKLHEATRTADHPLRNFGELIRLEPLDRSSAEQMIRAPMAALGLRFSESTETVDWLLTQTGCRPHLLARVCWAVVRLRKPPLGPAISLAEVTAAVLSCNKVREDFETWENGQANPLDRALIRAALLIGRPQRSELLQYLNERGISLSQEQMDASLGRLYSRHYALICDQEDRLYCPVPLFHHFLTDPSPEYPSHKHWHSAEDRLADELASDLAELQIKGPRPTNWPHSRLTL